MLTHRILHIIQVVIDLFLFVCALRLFFLTRSLIRLLKKSDNAYNDRDGGKY